MMKLLLIALAATVAFAEMVVNSQEASPTGMISDKQTQTHADSAAPPHGSSLIDAGNGKVQEDSEDQEADDEQDIVDDPDSDVDIHKVHADFKDADGDNSGYLEAPEVQALLSRIGAPPDFVDFEWKTFDKNKDGRLDRSELLQLAKGDEDLTELHKTQSNAMSLAQQGEENADEDEEEEEGEDSEFSDEELQTTLKQELKEADKDGDGLLDDKEMKGLLATKGAPSDFEWHKYDEPPKDGKLNYDELLNLARDHSGAGGEDEEDEDPSHTALVEEDKHGVEEEGDLASKTGVEEEGEEVAPSAKDVDPSAKAHIAAE